MFVCEENNEFSSLEKHVSGNVIVLLNVRGGFEMDDFLVITCLSIWLKS